MGGGGRGGRGREYSDPSQISSMEVSIGYFFGKLPLSCLAGFLNMPMLYQRHYIGFILILVYRKTPLYNPNASHPVYKLIVLYTEYNKNKFIMCYIKIYFLNLFLNSTLVFLEPYNL